MNNRYQLIKPIVSDKIYETSSLMKGAKKCYGEVKNSRISAQTFTIKNINSNEIYTFKIHKPYAEKMIGGAETQLIMPTLNDKNVILHQSVQKGGDIDEAVVNEMKTTLDGLVAKVTAVEEKIVEIEKKIEDAEKKFGASGETKALGEDKQSGENGEQQSQKNDNNTCVIM